MNQMKTQTKKWLMALLVRTVKTMAETALGFITVGAAISNIDWQHCISVTLVSGLVTILINFRDLPEVS